MDRLDLKVYEEDRDFQCAISSSGSLRDDREQEKMDGGNRAIVSHIVFETDSLAGEAVLDIITAAADLQSGETLETNGLSTLENLLSEVFAAGVRYGRSETKSMVSDV